MIKPYYTVISNFNEFCKFNMGDLEFDSIARKSCIRPDYDSAKDILAKVEKLNKESIAYYKSKLKDPSYSHQKDWLHERLDRCNSRTYQIIFVNFTVATGNEV